MGDTRAAINLAHVRYRCYARWRQTGQPPWAQRWVSVGQIAGGRWYVHLVAEVSTPARGYPDQGSACAAAERIKAWLAQQHGGEWEPVPCYPTQVAMAAQGRSPAR